MTQVSEHNQNVTPVNPEKPHLAADNPQPKAGSSTKAKVQGEDPDIEMADGDEKETKLGRDDDEDPAQEIIIPSYRSPT